MTKLYHCTVHIEQEYYADSPDEAAAMFIDDINRNGGLDDDVEVTEITQ